MVNIRLIQEIYSNAWFADPFTIRGLVKQLEYFRDGANYIGNESEKCNQFGYIDSKSNVIDADTISRFGENIPSGTIALYYFDGPITKNGGMSHNGTVDIATQFKKNETNENVIGHMFHVESGGGSANAVKYINEVTSSRKKPLGVYSEDIIGSAAYYISLNADFINVKSGDAIVGSIGTMMEIEGHKANTEDSTGKRHIRIYAPQSTMKNKGFEDAINDYNFEWIQKELLQPHCQEFIDDVKRLRPNVTNDQLTGDVFKASDCVGTLIDGIYSFEDSILQLQELILNNNTNNNTSQNNNINTNQNQQTMTTLQELQSAHPDIYAQAVEVGRINEVSRQKMISTYKGQAPKAVEAQIASGNGITSEFLEAVTQEHSLSLIENNAERSSILKIFAFGLK